jgi:hypothetical protein
MGIYYKTREIDYEKTLGSLSVGEAVTIPTSKNAIENLRAQVSKIAKKLPNGMVFSVSKERDGAVIRRTA